MAKPAASRGPAHVFKWLPVKLVWKNVRICIYCGKTHEELKRMGAI